MAPTAPRPELIVIVGPTASGKSELAMRIAKKYSGEIISADSRTIYEGMDIGTAKPSQADQKNITHWGIDLVQPGQRYSVKQFKDYASKAIKDIQARHELPILVGGTGLYINSIIFDYDFAGNTERDPVNPRHKLQKPNREPKPVKNMFLVGLDPGKEKLAKRIKKRVDQIVKADFIEEIKELSQKYGQNMEVFKAPGYQPALKYLDGEIDLKQLKQMFVTNDLKLAKKQRTWFKRNKFILWHEDAATAEQTIDRILNT